MKRSRRRVGCISFSLERLLFFVIKRLGRRAATRLLVMVKIGAISDPAPRRAHESPAEPVVTSADRTWKRGNPSIIENRFFGCTVVSRACWPPMAEMRLKLPAAAAAAQRRVERFFKKAFPRRVLQTVPNLGRVELEVTIVGETRAFRCSPVQFAVLQSVCENRGFFWRVGSRRDDGGGGEFRAGVSAGRGGGGSYVLGGAGSGVVRERNAAAVSSGEVLWGERAGDGWRAGRRRGVGGDAAVRAVRGGHSERVLRL